MTKIKRDWKNQIWRKLTKKMTCFVLLHIRGFIWNRGQTILLYCHWMRHFELLIGGENTWLWTLNETSSSKTFQTMGWNHFWISFSAFSLDFYTQHCFTRNSLVRNRMYSNFEQFYEKREDIIVRKSAEKLVFSVNLFVIYKKLDLIHNTA